MKLFSRDLTKYLTRINVKRKSFKLTEEGESPSWPEDLTMELLLSLWQQELRRLGPITVDQEAERKT